MMDKETYEREITRMFDSVRTNSRGEHTCSGVKCEYCPFYSVGVCHSYGAANAYDVYENAIKCIDYVEKWSKENPPKHKVSKMEYDVIKLFFLNYYSIKNNYTTFSDFPFLKRLIDLGHFENADYTTDIEDYLNNCEVIDK